MEDKANKKLPSIKAVLDEVPINEGEYVEGASDEDGIGSRVNKREEEMMN